jgi:V/A-type H+-transporting ATPase subunit E
MSLENLLERIHQEAAAQADEITKEASAERDTILKQAEEQAAAAAQRILDDASRGAKATQERAKAAGELEARKLILATKQGLISQALDETVETLAQMPDKEYRQVLSGMLVRSARGLGGGDVEVIVSDHDRARVTADFLVSVGGGEELGGRVTFRLSEETRPTGGGFVLRKGRIESNGTFPALATAWREELEALAAGLLFEEE